MLVQRDATSGSGRLLVGGMSASNSSKLISSNYLNQSMDKEQISVYRSQQYVRELQVENIVIQSNRIHEVMIIDNGGESIRKIFIMMGETLRIKCDVALNGQMAMD